VRSVSNLIAIAPSAQPFEVKRTIEAALQRSAKLEALNIAVSADGGKVTLAGRVNSWHERDLAEQAAWSAPGVTEVTDQLRVEP
jgi:osmotically-inducible protein OsmY